MDRYRDGQRFPQRHSSVHAHTTATSVPGKNTAIHPENRPFVSLNNHFEYTRAYTHVFGEDTADLRFGGSGDALRGRLNRQDLASPPDEFAGRPRVCGEASAKRQSHRISDVAASHPPVRRSASELIERHRQDAVCPSEHAITVAHRLGQYMLCKELCGHYLRRRQCIAWRAMYDCFRSCQSLIELFSTGGRPRPAKLGGNGPFVVTELGPG